MKGWLKMIIRLRERELCAVPPAKDTFGTLMVEVHERMGGDFPNTAAIELPGILSEATKEKLMKIPVDKVSHILVDSIEEINCGSIEPIEKLVNKRLRLLRQ